MFRGALRIPVKNQTHSIQISHLFVLKMVIYLEIIIG